MVPVSEILFGLKHMHWKKIPQTTLNTGDDTAHESKTQTHTSCFCSVHSLSLRAFRAALTSILKPVGLPLFLEVFGEAGCANLFPALLVVFRGAYQKNMTTQIKNNTK